MLMLISFIVAVVVISILAYILFKQNRPTGVKLNYSSKDLQSKSYDMEMVKAKWGEILAGTSSASGVKNGLIEADKLLDYVMRAKGFSGETMIDRLKKAQAKFSDKEKVWQAHKLRNSIVHEVEQDLVVPQVKESIEAIGQAIKDLGVNL